MTPSSANLGWLCSVGCFEIRYITCLEALKLDGSRLVKICLKIRLLTMSAHLMHRILLEDSSPQQLVEVPVEESAHYILLTRVMCHLFLLLKLHQTVSK